MNIPKDYILWLPSWYPNKYTPNNGDFIQRHAIATSKYCNLIVIQFLQLGEDINVEEEEIINYNDNLIELTVVCAFKTVGNKSFDKIRYNLKYYNHAKQYLKVFFHKYGLPKIVHVHIPLKSGNIAIWLKNKYRINYIVSEQASHYMHISPDSFFKKNYLYKKQVSRIFRNALLVTNVSNTIGHVLKSLFNLKNVLVIHNTVNTDYFNLQKEKQEVFTYIHVSSLNDQKNIFAILNAFKKLFRIYKDWKLELVGPFKKEIKDFIVSNSLENHIILVGELPYQMVAQHMKKAHVFILFSKHENFPCVVVEALCCGLPVISSDVAGVKEAVNNENGILIQSEDNDAFLHSIIEIRRNYNSYDNKSISQKAIAKYNYEQIGKQFFVLYP